MCCSRIARAAFLGLSCAPRSFDWSLQNALFRSARRMHCSHSARSASEMCENPSFSSERAGPAHEGQFDRSRLQDVVVAGRRLLGVSVGSSETCIISPEHMAFDIGRCPLSAVRMQVVAFTHLHVDHVAGLPFHLATRNLQKMAPPIYLVPRAVAPEFNAMIEAFARLDGSKFKYTVVPMSPGDSYALKKGWVVRSFQTMHTVPSQGYILYQTRNKLYPEYSRLGKEELMSFRRDGKEISESVLIPEIAVTGDTTLDALAKCADARRANTLVTEVTFLDESSTIHTARNYGHVHVDEVVERADELFLETRGVLLTHFSARYSSERILDILRARLPEKLFGKVTPLVGERIIVAR
jgi:ribonuclease Z